MIKVLFFAELREQLNCIEHHVDWQDLISQYASPTIKELLEYLCEAQPAWSQPLKARPWLVAQNQAMATHNHAINPNDEIALFPPVTGG